MWFLKLTVTLAGVYAVVVALAYGLQSWLIFPAGLAGSGPHLPAGARHVELAVGEGDHVVLARLPARQAAEGGRPLILGLGGNAWNADALALMLHEMLPEHEVAALHYRGYGPSSGRASAAALFEDARRAHDHLAQEAPEGVAVGLSIGAAVAVELAASRPLRGLVLVTPFDSLKELAAGHYPWLPVRLLLRHRMEAAEVLHGVDVPAAIIAAENDFIVPAARSAPLRKAARRLRSDITIEAAGHNDIYGRADFVEALRRSVAAVSGD